MPRGGEPSPDVVEGRAQRGAGGLEAQHFSKRQAALQRGFGGKDDANAEVLSAVVVASPTEGRTALVWASQSTKERATGLEKRSAKQLPCRHLALPGRTSARRSTDRRFHHEKPWK